MFLKYKVTIPEAPGKLVRKNRGGQTFIELEYKRVYNPKKRGHGKNSQDSSADAGDEFTFAG